EKPRARGFEPLVQETPPTPTLEWNRSSVEMAANAEEPRAETSENALPAAASSALPESGLEAGDLERTKELEPWLMPASPDETGSVDRIATALERVASRIRAGEVRVSSASEVESDESALAAALAALFRTRR
nr:hypothetical protein [Gemmatimonadota bacterium]